MKDANYFPRPSSPGQVRREINRDRRDEQKMGPPKPPRRKGPEKRSPDGELERALVKKFKNGGCVMGNRGVRDTKMV